MLNFDPNYGPNLRRLMCWIDARFEAVHPAEHILQTPHIDPHGGFYTEFSTAPALFFDKDQCEREFAIRFKWKLELEEGSEKIKPLLFWRIMPEIHRHETDGDITFKIYCRWSVSHKKA